MCGCRRGGSLPRSLLQGGSDEQHPRGGASRLLRQAEPRPARRGGTVMAEVIVKSLDRPDESRTPSERGRIDLVTLDQSTVGRAVFQPGWRWSEDVKPADGTELELRPGDAFVIAPGHDAWVIGDEPCVTLDYSGTVQLAGTPARESGGR